MKIRKKNKHAHIAFDQVIKLENTHAPAHFETADLYLAENNLEKAIKFLKKSVDLYEKQGTTEGNSKARKVLLTGEEKLSVLYVENGNKYFRKKQLKKAIDAYSKTFQRFNFVVFKKKERSCYQILNQEILVTQTQIICWVYTHGQLSRSCIEITMELCFLKKSA